MTKDMEDLYKEDSKEIKMKILYYRKTSCAELSELAVKIATLPKGNLQSQCNFPQDSMKCFRELEIQNKTKIRTNHNI